jgi:hypothetical protein
MEQTALRLSRRSTELKKVDEALKKYTNRVGDSDSFFELLHAFDDWKATKTDWSKSKRNHKGTVFQLNKDLQFQPIFQSHLSQMANDERDALKKLLANKKLDHKVTFSSGCNDAIKTAYKTLKLDSDVGRIGQGISNPNKTASFTEGPLAKKLIRAAFGSEGSDAEMNNAISKVLGSNFTNNFVKDAVPIISTLYSGYKLVDYWTTTGKRQWDKYQLECGRGSIRAGNASAALNAVKQKIQREQNENARKAVMQTAAFACKVAAPPGVGSAAAAVNSIGQLGETIFQIGRDYREKNAANKAMKNDFTVTADIFNVNPILGCYYLVSCTRSNILNILFTDTAYDGWQSEAERMNKEIAPIIAMARKCIKDSRYTIEGMPLFATHVIPPDDLTEKQKKVYLQNHLKGREAFKRQQKYYSGGVLYRLLHKTPKSYAEKGISSDSFN